VATEFMVSEIPVTYPAAATSYHAGEMIVTTSGAFAVVPGMPTVSIKNINPIAQLLVRVQAMGWGYIAGPNTLYVDVDKTTASPTPPRSVLKSGARVDCPVSGSREYREFLSEHDYYLAPNINYTFQMLGRKLSAAGKGSIKYGWLVAMPISYTVAALPAYPDPDPDPN
jgi:hypothetical protein